MTATNHALTGALIGLSVGHSAALFLAFASHFALDALPHYGSSLPDEVALKKKSFRNYLVVEALLCFLVVVALRLGRPEYWVLPAACAFLAAAPDLFSVNKFLKTRAGKPWKPNIYSRFAGRIQWFQHPIGAVVEVAWGTGALVLLGRVLSS